MSRENNRTLKVGDAVRICLENIDLHYESDSRWLTQHMKRFNGVETTVTRVIRYKWQAAYELEGVTNKCGLPYTWCREALLKLKRASHENRND